MIKIKNIKLFSPLFLLVVSSCGTLSSTSSEEWIKINYQTPTQSTISASTISYGKQTNGTYANIRRSESVLLDSKISPNEAKRAIGQTTPVSFFDEEGNTISIKPYLIDFIPFKDITYLVYSSIPLSEERYRSSLAESSSHYPLLQMLIDDLKNDEEDIFSYYLVNNRSGKILDLKEELNKFEIYLNEMNGYQTNQSEITSSTSSGGSGLTSTSNSGHCKLVPGGYYFKILSFGFLADVGCRHPGDTFYNITDKVLFSFDSNINEFTYRFADVSNVWFNFISSNGVGFGIVSRPSPRFPRELELIKYNFNTNEHEVVTDLINHFNPLIYTVNGVTQPQWFEQLYLQNPIMVDDEFVYYANFDNIVKLDLNLNFVDHIHRQSPNAHAFRTLQNFMDGIIPRFIGTMDHYHVYLVNEFNPEKDNYSARMMLIDLETIEIIVSDAIPFAISYFVVVGTSIVGYNHADIKDLELFQWKMETNKFTSLYQFNLVSESQLHGDYQNLLPTPSNEVVSTGYTRILQPSTTSSRLDYKVISLLTGTLYGINENKPEQTILISKKIT
jgi:hypothetical protein